MEKIYRYEEEEYLFPDLAYRLRFYTPILFKHPSPPNEEVKELRFLVKSIKEIVYAVRCAIRFYTLGILKGVNFNYSKADPFSDWLIRDEFNYRNCSPIQRQAYVKAVHLISWLHSQGLPIEEVGQKFKNHVNDFLIELLPSCNNNTPLLQNQPIALLMGIPRKPTGTISWVLENDFHCVRLKGAEQLGSREKPVQLPWGVFPRRILLYLFNEFSLRNDNKISLGKDRSEFFHYIGYPAQGHDYKKLKTQFIRLTNFLFHVHASPQIHRTIKGVLDRSIFANELVDYHRLFDSVNLWDSNDPHVILSPYLIYKLKRRPVLIDFEAVKELGSSTLKLDFYLFLADRLHRIPRSEKEILPWPVLTKLFSNDENPEEELGKHVRRFKYKFTKGKVLANGERQESPLDSVLSVYPRARVKMVKEGLVLHRSPPPIELHR